MEVGMKLIIIVISIITAAAISIILRILYRPVDHDNLEPHKPGRLSRNGESPGGNNTASNAPRDYSVLPAEVDRKRYGAVVAEDSDVVDGTPSTGSQALVAPRDLDSKNPVEEIEKTSVKEIFAALQQKEYVLVLNDGCTHCQNQLDLFKNVDYPLTIKCNRKNWLFDQGFKQLLQPIAESACNRKMNFGLECPIWYQGGINNVVANGVQTLKELYMHAFL
jgi:hypothetical protein